MIDIYDTYKAKSWINNGDHEVDCNPIFEVTISDVGGLRSCYGFNDSTTAVDLENSDSSISLIKTETNYINDDDSVIYFEPMYNVYMLDKKTGQKKEYYLTDIEPDSYKNRIPQYLIDKEEARQKEMMIEELACNEDGFFEVFGATYEELRLNEEETVVEVVRRLF